MNTSKQVPSHIIELIILREMGSLTQQQESELDEFVEISPEFRDEVQDYANIIRTSLQVNRSRMIDQKRAWLHVNNDIKNTIKPVSLFQKNKWLKYAAALIPLIIFSGLLFFQLKEKEDQIAQYSEIMSSVRENRAKLVLGTGETVMLDGSLAGTTIEKEGVVISRDNKDRISYRSAQQKSLHRLVVPRGGEYQIVLPDGSLVFINSGSFIEYPTVFEDDLRQVTLEGEAFFMVTQDTLKPFVVNSPDFSIMVTGTDFNVYNYPDDMATTTLVSGSVTVSSAFGDGVELKPGQQACISNLNNQFTVRDVDVEIYTSWIDGVFVFKDLPLSELVKRMERWYDVDIEFENVNAGKNRFTGAMEKDKAFKDVVWLIEQSANVAFKIKDNKAVIH